MSSGERYVVGIDPGFGGAIAVYSQDDGVLDGVYPMPLKENLANTRGYIDAAKICDLLHPIALDIKRVVIERVNASPQMGVTSAFRFGEGFGTLVGVIGAMRLPLLYAYPAVWKAAMGLSSNKKDSQAKAIALFPAWEATFKRSRSSADFAEAALLAWYGADVNGKGTGSPAAKS